MSEISKFREEFHAKVKELQDNCPHEEWTNWVNPHWALGHPHLFEVRVCKRCDKEMERINFTLLEETT